MAGLPNPIDSGFLSGTFPPATVYATQGIQPANALPVTKDTVLTFSFSSSIIAQVFVSYRILLPDGRITHSSFLFTTQANRQFSSVALTLTDGFLLSAFVYSPFASPRGSVFCDALISIGGTASLTYIAQLFSGYVSFFDTIGWPPGRWEPAANGAGNIRSITGTLPSAGSDMIETCPSNARWRVLAFKSILNTAVAVANRNVHAVLDDGVGAHVYFDGPAQAVQAASLTVTYIFGTNLISAAPLDGVALINLPSPLIVEAGHRIRSFTSSLQAADTWNAPQYVVEEWLTT